MKRMRWISVVVGMVGVMGCFADEAKVIPLSPEEKASVESATMTSLPGAAGLTKYPMQHDASGVVIEPPGRKPVTLQIESNQWTAVQGMLPDQVPAVKNLAPDAPGEMADTLFDIYAGIKLHGLSLGEKLQKTGPESEEGRRIVAEGEAWGILLRAIESVIFSGSRVEKGQ